MLGVIRAERVVSVLRWPQIPTRRHKSSACTGSDTKATRLDPEIDTSRSLLERRGGGGGEIPPHIRITNYRANHQTHY